MSKKESLRRKVESFEGSKDPFVSSAIENTATAIVVQAAQVKRGQNVLLWFDTLGMPLIKEMNLRCEAAKANVDFFMRDYEKDAREIGKLDKAGIHNYFNEEEDKMNWADTVLIVRGPANPEAMQGVASDKTAAYLKRYGDIHQVRADGKIKWTLFMWPTEYEAKKEGLPYDEYFKEYMEACNQPWDKIRETQALLKRQLDKGKSLQLIANAEDPDPKKRTDVTMSIEDMKFGNSTIDVNYPGSEVFSAPIRTSVKGQIYAAGEYVYDSELMRNIGLQIQKGKIVEAEADGNNDGLQRILSQGKGARYFGEVALGTNPGLKRRFFNDLLNEKVGGSFHMAIGKCYTYDTYAGEPVKVNNGNTGDLTPVHWDLTVLMHRKPDGSGGGKVTLDDKVIQQDGKFLDPQLQLLNPKI